MQHGLTYHRTSYEDEQAPSCQLNVCLNWFNSVESKMLGKVIAMKYLGLCKVFAQNNGSLYVHVNGGLWRGRKYVENKNCPAVQPVN